MSSKKDGFKVNFTLYEEGLEPNNLFFKKKNMPLKEFESEFKQILKKFK